MRILHAVHDYLPRHRAGTEVYVAELGRRQREDGHEVHVLCAEYDPDRLHGSIEWRWHDGLPVTEIANGWRFESFEETYRSRVIGAAIAHVLDAVAPDVVHVHNLLDLTLELPSLAAARGIPCVATLHDFSLDCPSGGQRLHLADRDVCAVVDPARCATCFPRSDRHGRMALARLARRTVGARVAGRVGRTVLRRWPALFERLRRAVPGPVDGLSAAEIETRLRYVREHVLPHVSQFVAPSQALAGGVQHFGLPDGRIRVSDYGMVPFEPVPRQPRGTRLRIGYAGTLTRVKGVHVLLEALRRLPAGRFEVEVHGDPTTDAAYADELRRQATGLPVRFRGAFGRERLPTVLAGLDVVVVPSVWPENSPLVAHEAFLAGVPVVASRIGGLPDLVRDDRLLFAAGSPDGLAEVLRELVERPSRLDEIAARLPAVKTIGEDAAEWRAAYEAAIGTRGPAGAPPRPRLAVVIVHYRTPWDVVLAVRSVASSRRPADEVLVVDNGSGDDCVAILERELSGVRLVRGPHNLGFAGGCNLGLREALDRGARTVLLLNSDAMLAPETLGRLESALGGDVGIAGPVVRRADDPSRIESAGIRFDPATGRMRLLAHDEVFDGDLPDRRVDGVSGCALMVRREVLERVGLLDEGTFFGFEDLDLCLRAAEEGFATVRVGRAVAYHGEGRSLDPRSPRRLYFATRNHLRLARRRAPRGGLGGMLRDAGIVLAAVAHALRRRAGLSGLRAVLRGVRDHLAGRDGPDSTTS